MKDPTEILEASQVTVTEVAKLLRVSRVSVSKWLNGRGAPSKFHAPRLERVLALLQQAVDTGHLPKALDPNTAPYHIRRRDRLEYIRQQLKASVAQGQSESASEE